MQLNAMTTDAQTLCETKSFTQPARGGRNISVGQLRNYRSGRHRSVGYLFHGLASLEWLFIGPHAFEILRLTTRTRSRRSCDRPRSKSGKDPFCLPTLTPCRSTL